MPLIIQDGTGRQWSWTSENLGKCFKILRGRPGHFWHQTQNKKENLDTGEPIQLFLL